jgi:excisionase family DNA binding protein
LSIGRTLVFALIRDGKLRSVKIGRRRVVPVEAIEEFLAQGTTFRSGPPFTNNTGASVFAEAEMNEKRSDIADATTQ